VAEEGEGGRKGGREGREGKEGSFVGRSSGSRGGGEERWKVGLWRERMVENREIMPKPE
jgi:hypothetical protein